MIARLWTGRTTPEDADAYEELLRTEILPHIAEESSDGYRGAEVLRREREEDVEFLTVLRFETEADLRSFAGEEETERAVVPEAARRLLVSFDREARHYRRVLLARESGEG